MATVAAAVLLVMTAGGGAARASGFALKEQSSTAQGNAFAGATAGAEDISFMFFNPAGLTRHDGMQAQSVVSYIVPHSRTDNARATTASGAPIPGESSSDDIGVNAVLPAFYGMLPLGDDLRLGVGVNLPFGLKTDHDEAYVGRYHALDSRLTTVNISPSLAYRFRRWLSLGAGLQAQYASAKLSNAIDFGSIGAALGLPGALPGQQDGFARVRGDDWGFGYTLGVLLEPWPGTRFGAGYRSKVHHNLTGDEAKFDRGVSGMGDLISGLSGRFVDTDVEAEATTPAMLTLGAYHEITDRIALMGEFAWTEWSAFDELRIRFDNPAQPDSLVEENWQDSLFFALGATYRPDDSGWSLRAGVAYDQSPVRNKFRTPRIPDADRTWLSLGVGYRAGDWLDVTASFTHIMVDDGDIRLRSDGLGNTFRGNLDARYDNSINILTFGGRIRF